MQHSVSRTLEADLALAQRLADAAGATSRRFFGREFQRWSKADGTVATEADLAVEDEIRGTLARERPTDAVLGEERGLTGGGDRRWIVDGIDGTVDFAAESPDWGTLIALEVNSRVVVGVYDQPMHRRRYWATKAGGAWSSDGGLEDPERLTVSSEAGLRHATSFVTDPKWLTDDRERRVADAIRNVTQSRPVTNHPAIQVATGGYELAIFMRAGPWDLAATALILEEAGGRFSDFAGRHGITSGNAVFTNGQVHDEIIRLIQAALSPAA